MYSVLKLVFTTVRMIASRKTQSTTFASFCLHPKDVSEPIWRLEPSRVGFESRGFRRVLLSFSWSGPKGPRETWTGFIVTREYHTVYRFSVLSQKCHCPVRRWLKPDIRRFLHPDTGSIGRCVSHERPFRCCFSGQQDWWPYRSQWKIPSLGNGRSSPFFSSQSDSNRSKMSCMY